MDSGGELTIGVKFEVNVKQCLLYIRKSLKIPKGYSETTNRRTQSTMVKREKTKGQAIIDKTLHRKLKIVQYESN